MLMLILTFDAGVDGEWVWGCGGLEGVCLSACV